MNENNSLENNEYSDEELTLEEEKKITIITSDFNEEMKQKTGFSSSLSFSNPTKDNKASFFSMSKKVKITNISGKTAWVVISPEHVTEINSISIDRLFRIELRHINDFKKIYECLNDNTTKIVSVDTKHIYYTILFKCDEKWKIAIKNRKLNIKKYDINILKKHYDNSVDFESLNLDNIL